MAEKNIYFDSHDPSELEQVITTQRKVINYQQKKTYIFIPNIDLH